MTYQQRFPGVDKQEVMTSAVDVHQSIYRRWVKTLGNVMWLQPSEGTHMYGRRNDINAHWHWQIVNPMMNATTHWTGSQLARPNKKGGSEMGKYPHVKRNDNACLPLLCGILPPTKRGTLTTHRRVASYSLLEMTKMKTRQETRIDSQSRRMCSLKKRRAVR